MVCVTAMAMRFLVIIGRLVGVGAAVLPEGDAQPRGSGPVDDCAHPAETDLLRAHHLRTQRFTGTAPRIETRAPADGGAGRRIPAGCVRQATQEAAHLWERAPIGTTVVVLP